MPQILDPDLGLMDLLRHLLCTIMLLHRMLHRLVMHLRMMMLLLHRLLFPSVLLLLGAAVLLP
jgi:hypothetical protein